MFYNHPSTPLRTTTNKKKGGGRKSVWVCFMLISMFVWTGCCNSWPDVSRLSLFIKFTTNAHLTLSVSLLSAKLNLGKSDRVLADWTGSCLWRCTSTYMCPIMNRKESGEISRMQLRLLYLYVCICIVSSCWYLMLPVDVGFVCHCSCAVLLRHYHACSCTLSSGWNSNI